MNETGDRYDRGDIERIFKGSVPEDIYEALLADPGSIDPLGTEFEYTALFSDIRDATIMLEPLSVRGKVKIIADCLELSERHVVANGGYVEKFMGDATLALFGAVGGQSPREQALSACRAAVAMIRGYAKLGVNVGIGINRGLAYMGNMATRRHPYYTPFGSEINLGSRMETESKRLRHDLVITESVASLVGSDFRVVPADSIRTKFSGAKTLYALIGPEAELSKAQRGLWDRYQAAYDQLESGRTEEALAELGTLQDHPDAIPFLRFAYDRARSRVIEQVDARFAAAPDLPGLYAELATVTARVFGGTDGSAPGIAAPTEDGTWRFMGSAGLPAPSIILAPDGDIVVWLKGLQGAASLQAEPSGTGDLRTSPACGDAVSAPTAAVDLPFSLAAPLRFRNEAVGAIFASPANPGPADAGLLASIAERFSRPFAELSLSSIRERYREKVSAEERLSAANQELEMQSLELQRAMSDVRELNLGLEARVKEQVERLERAFKLGRYLPPELVEAVLDGRKRLEPSFERRKITVFFSDVQGFTAATDSIEPEELARLLNEYLSTMSGIAFRHGGTIDKFRGDGMMVLFGAPERMEPGEAARRCAAMAVDMCRATEVLKARWDDEGYDWDIGVRIGINTGYATVGEFGCEQRMDYTAIGSEVNLASRLESACEVGGITLSHAAYALVKDSFPCVPRGEVTLKGIARPVRVYELTWRDVSPTAPLGTPPATPTG